MFHNIEVLDVVDETTAHDASLTGVTQASDDPYLHTVSILVPLDGSPLAEKALPAAGVLAQALSAELILLRVVPAMRAWVDESIEVAEPFERMIVRHRAEAQSYLTFKQSQLHHLGVPIEIETAYGPVAESILEYAEWKQVALIVLCTHHYSNIRRWFHARVARKILRDACCPTLMIADESGCSQTRELHSALHILQVREAAKTT